MWYFYPIDLINIFVLFLIFLYVRKEEVSSDSSP